MKYLNIIGLLLLFTSCEKTLESESMTSSDVSDEVILNLGFACINDSEISMTYECLGGANLSNRQIEIIGPGGEVTGVVDEWFGAELAFGNGLTYNDNTGSLELSSEGALVYYISMTDDSDPIDTTLSIELDVSYKADIIYSDARSIAEFEEQEANDSFKGRGTKSINITFKEIDDHHLYGTFWGNYVDMMSQEEIEICGQFNLERFY